jgi:bifunctional DNA-binding transcriptional regulator/antitoxin component of YhaV-PrlF toxin-antitoxin module
MNNVYEAPVEVDSDGDLILVFPDELLAAMDWNEGDTLVWTQNDDDTWTLKRNENSNTE